MVLLIMKADFNPDKMDAYLQWVPGAIKRVLNVPGIKEIRAFRSVTGKYQSISTYEFEDMESWAKWNESKEVQEGLNELAKLTNGFTLELYEASSLLPDPLRP